MDIFTICKVSTYVQIRFLNVSKDNGVTPIIPNPLFVVFPYMKYFVISNDRRKGGKLFVVGDFPLQFNTRNAIFCLR